MRKISAAGCAGVLSIASWFAATLASSADGDGGLEEIIVTAERREGDVQKTPMNISVVQGDDIQEQGLNNMQQILQGLPGVTVQGQVRGFNPSVRGLGTDLPPGSAQGSVAVQFDGVYDVRAESGRIGYFDLARVEVLAGPQGTLYGVNSDGGVVNIISNDPSLDRFDASFQLQAGSFSLQRAEGMVNLPMGETAALRLAAVNLQRDGYLDSGTSDEDGSALRAKLLWQPNENISLLTGVDLARLRGRGAGSVNPYVNGDATRQFFGIGFVTVPSPWTSASSSFFTLPAANRDTFQRDRFNSEKYWADLKWTVGPVNIQFVPSYKSNDNLGVACGMGPCDPALNTCGPPPLGGQCGISNDPLRLVQRSQELRLTNSSSEGVQWAAGAYHWYYLQENTGAGPPGSRRTQDSFGVFAEATVPFGDGWRARVGGRSTRDEKTQQTILGLFNVTPAPGFRSTKFDHVDYRVGIEYDLRPQSMIYATVATGYRPGGFNSPQADYVNEEVTDVEIGTKNRFMNDRLQFNTNIFYYDFKNYQLLNFYFTGPCSGMGAFPPTFNVPKAKNIGLDAALSALVTDNDTLNVTFNYLDATFKGNTTIFYNTIDSCARFNAGLDPTQVASVGSFNINGSTQPRAPKVSTNISWEHRFPLANGHQIAVRPQVRYQDDSYTHPMQYNVSFQPAYSIYDLSATYSAGAGNWNVALWGRNLGNKAVKQSAFPVTLNEPRTYGATFTWRME